MPTNLINQLLGEFRGDTLNSVASALGESPSKTQSALSAVVPALFGGLANKTSTVAGADAVLETIRQNRFDSGRFLDTANAVKGPTGITGLIDAGRPLVDSIFGSRTSAVADWASSFAGVSRSSASSLLGLALPLILGQIGRQMKGAGWSGANLMSLLAGQRSFLQDAPPGLAGILGADETTGRRVNAHETAPAHAAPVVGSYQRAAHAPVVGTYEAASRRSSPWLWIVPLLLLIPLLAYFLGRRDEPVRQAVVEVEQPAIPRVEVPKPVGTGSVPTLPAAALGPLINRTLPNNVALRIPSNGVESHLLGYIEDRSRPANSETWFSFDRIEFDTDSARLTQGSTEQIRNVAEILKAYPQVEVEIGGHTDNVADDTYNVKLSQERAASTMNAIASYGIDRSRMEAEGYGENRPVADNSTAEGRQSNRRVDIRVTDK